MAKKFDINVYEIDNNGQKKCHQENGVMANSSQELIGIYRMCGQEIQIVREYSDSDSQNYGKNKLLNQEDAHMGTGALNGTGFMQVNPEEQKKIDEFIQMKEQSQETQQKKSISDFTSIDQSTNTKTNSNLQKPMFFQVGGIQCKLENEKMYQKQWIRLTDTEASEFRIISDKNNKICPLKDKHIEIMKWVAIENSENNTNQNTENDKRDLLNG